MDGDELSSGSTSASLCEETPIQTEPVALKIPRKTTPRKSIVPSKSVKNRGSGIRKSERVVKKQVTVLGKKPRLSDQEEKRKKRRLKQGTVIERTIRRLQAGTERLSQRKPLERMIRDIVADWKEDAKLSRTAVSILHEVAEAELISVFDAGQMITNTTEHDMLMLPEFRLAAKQRGLLPMDLTPADFATVKRNRARRIAEIARLKALRREARAAVAKEQSDK